MSKEEFFQEKVHAKLYALSLIYEKEESCRQQFLVTALCANGQSFAERSSAGIKADVNTSAPVL